MTYYFGSADALHDRIAFAHSKQKPVIFVVGAPLTAPVNGSGEGVPGVNEIVDVIKNEFATNAEARKNLESVLRTSGQSSYQNAFEFLISRRGLEQANQVVRKAVISAYKGKVDNIEDMAQLERAEKDFQNWHLSPAVENLGKVLALNSSKNPSIVLTTNFDPLIQIAVAKAGGKSFTTMLHREGNILQTRADGIHVVHLHGSWRGSDTLHTTRQLNQERPQLKSSLANVARNALVVAVGYGGWDDVITSTLSELVMDDSSYPEIAWSFYSSSQEDIIASNRSLLEKLNAGIDRGRVSLYSSIDCHQFFPVLSKLLEGDSKLVLSTPELTPGQARLASMFDEQPSKNSPVNALPKTDVWFGREQELQRLKTSRAKVVAITGIGGQGKSSLASTYFDSVRKPNESGFFDWKDCREQGNTINLAICSAIEKASEGKISVADVAKNTISELVVILLRELVGRSGVIVFDNVDYYVDLETNEPLNALKVLIEGVLASNTGVLFLFTARPIMRVEQPDYLELRLYGLARDDAQRLFEFRYGDTIDSVVFDNLYAATAGHPLWLSIIAAQCYGTGKPIETILDGFEGSGLELPKQMLRQTWALLNANQQHVLRTLAELERPESERNIEEITELNYNRLGKALTRLKSMCLIERKVTQSKVEVVDLHPLIRQFVREDFGKKERETFITKVILYLDKRIIQFKAKLEGNIPHMVAEMWIHKIDLQINSGAIGQAIHTLLEIVGQLDKNGLNEEISRLAKRIFSVVDWLDVTSEFGNFDTLFNKSMRSVIEVEGGEEAEKWLLKYEQNIAGKGAQYINLCDIQAYRFWFQRDFSDSIMWAERGRSLKKKSNVDTVFQCDHTLALAQRDSGDLEHAFDYFRDGLTDEQILSDETVSKRPAQFFGNLGRCYHFSGQIDLALFAYQKAAVKLDDGSSSVIDQGYIRYWVGQAMAEKGRREDAVMFLRAAIEKWERIAPSLTIDPASEVGAMVNAFSDLSVAESAPQWKCENRFAQWTTEQLK